MALIKQAVINSPHNSVQTAVKYEACWLIWLWMNERGDEPFAWWRCEVSVLQIQVSPSAGLQPEGKQDPPPAAHPAARLMDEHLTFPCSPPFLKCTCSHHQSHIILFISWLEAIRALGVQIRLIQSQLIRCCIVSWQSRNVYLPHRTPGFSISALRLLLEKTCGREIRVGLHDFIASSPSTPNLDAP